MNVHVPDEIKAKYPHMEFESNTDILRDLMNQLHILHKENAKLIQEVEQLKEINSELNRKLKSIQALFL